MRYTMEKLYPGKKKVITRFLLVPRLVDGEWRWLERASWSMEVKPKSGAYGLRYLEWYDISWVKTKNKS